MQFIASLLRRVLIVDSSLFEDAEEFPKSFLLGDPLLLLLVVWVRKSYTVLPIPSFNVIIFSLTIERQTLILEDRQEIGIILNKLLSVSEST